MDNIIPTEEFTEVEGRVYSNPQVGIDEASRFIDNLRATQGQQNQEIAEQTYNLGTAVPSVQGGLGAPTDTGLAYFASRYQTPQTNAVAANLRTAAQAQALNEVLANEQAIWKNRYQQAYRDYQRRQYRKANTPRTTSPATPTTTKPVEEDITTDNTTVEIGNVSTEAIAKSRYQKLLMKYLQAGYPASEAEAHAKDDFGKSISVDAPVEPYGGK